MGDPETQSLQENPEVQQNQQTVTKPDRQEENESELLESFSLNGLFDHTHSAKCLLRSADEEMGAAKPNYSGRPNYDHIPEVVRNIPENEQFFEFLMKPPADLRQIKQRQALAESLIRFEDLVDLKNIAHGFHTGINGLFMAVGGRNQYEYLPMLKAFREGMDIYSDSVNKCFRKIENGRRALVEIHSKISNSTNPFLQKIAGELKKLIDETMFLTQDYFLTASFGKVEENAKSKEKEISKFVYNFGIFTEFARLGRTDGYTKATYDPVAPRQYKQGWTFVRKKEGQVRNDSPKESPITLYAGSNMSGKSFSGLKKEFFMQLLAQTFGYVPAEGDANFPILHDSFNYLDRASTNHQANLSAFGQEMEDWKAAADNLGKNSKMCIDEGCSTTSPEDQYRLLGAFAIYWLQQRGVRVFLANHNERVADLCEGNNNAKVYHFQVNVSGETVEYTYKLCEDPDDSNALEVARVLGMNPEILNITVRYLRGDFQEVIETGRPNYKKIRKYSHKKREELKKGEMTWCAGREQPTCFLSFSNDANFRYGLRLSEHDKTQDVFIGNWSPLNRTNRHHLLDAFVLHAGQLSPEEVMERQRTFAQLAKSNKFYEMAELETRAFYQLHFMHRLPDNSSGLLQFNLEVNPFDKNTTHGIDQVDLCIAFLEMNKKLLRERFALDEDLKKLKEAKSRYEAVKTMVEATPFQDWDSLLTKYREDMDGIDVSETEEARLFPTKFGDIDDQNQQYGDRVTLLRIRRFLTKYASHYTERYIRDKDAGMLERFIGHQDSYHSDLEERYEGALEAFEKVVKILGEENPERWGGKITAGRIRALKERFNGATLEQLGGKYDPEAEYTLKDYFREQLAFLENELSRAGEYMDLGFRDAKYNGRCTLSAVRGDLVKAMEVTLKFATHLKPVNIFECDLSEIQDEYAKIMEHYRKHYRRSDCEYYNTWPSHLVLALIVEQLMYGKNPLQEFLNGLRGVDSVHTAQAANSIQDAYHQFSSRGIGSFSPSAVIEKGRRLMASPESSASFSDLEKLEDERVQIFQDYPQESLTGSGEDSYRIFDLADYFANNREGERDAEHFIVNYLTYKFRRYPSRDNPYLVRIENARAFKNRRQPGETYGDVLKDFVKNEITAEEKQRIIHFSGRMKKLGEMAVAVSKEHRIKIPDESLKKLSRGDLEPLRRALGEVFQNEFARQFPRYFGSGGEKMVQVELSRAMALYLAGHVIREAGHSSVKFNSTGEIKIDDMYSLLFERKGQVKNDIDLSREKPATILGSSNMSGKTFMGKSAVAAVLWSMATGHAPGSHSTMPIFDRVIYFDRITSRDDASLSAYGHEVKRFMESLEASKEGQVTFSFYDEFGSSTSPKYQSALYYSVVVHSLMRGQYSIFASHAHDATDKLSEVNGGRVKVAHFITKKSRDTEGKLHMDFQYKLSPDREDSNAVDVAETLGLNPEIIKIARILDPK